VPTEFFFLSSLLISTPSSEPVFLLPSSSP
jgi:hypothetical protein